MAYRDGHDKEKEEGVVSDEALGEVLDKDEDEDEDPIATEPPDDEKAWE